MSDIHYLLRPVDFLDKTRDPSFVRIDRRKGRIGNTIYCVTTPPEDTPFARDLMLASLYWSAPSLPSQSEFRAFSDGGLVNEVCPQKTPLRKRIMSKFRAIFQCTFNAS